MESMDTTKVLLAIETCHKYHPHRTLAQRQSWLPHSPFPHKFFYGVTQPLRSRIDDDEIFLAVPDDYPSLPLKTRAIVRYAIARDYQFMVKMDDDTWINPPLLEGSGYDQYDYVGMRCDPHDGWPAPYAAGGFYWLSRKAMEIVSEMDIHDSVEDRGVGNVLLANDIRLVDTGLHSAQVFIDPLSSRYRGDSEQGKISIHECTPEYMDHLTRVYL